MEAAEHRRRDDLAVTNVVVVRRAVRDPLPDSLMRPGPIEIDRVLSGYFPQVLFAENEHMVERLT